MARTIRKKAGKRKAPSRRRTTRRTRRVKRKSTAQSKRNKLVVAATSSLPGGHSIVGPTTAAWMTTQITPMASIIGNDELRAAPPAVGVPDRVHQFNSRLFLQAEADTTGNTFYFSENPLFGVPFDMYTSRYWSPTTGGTQQNNWAQAYAIRWSQNPVAVRYFRDLYNFIRSLGLDVPGAKARIYFPSQGLQAVCPTNVQGGPSQGVFRTCAYECTNNPTWPNVALQTTTHAPEAPMRTADCQAITSNEDESKTCNAIPVISMYYSRKNLATVGGKAVIAGFGDDMYNLVASRQQDQEIQPAMAGIHLKPKLPEDLGALSSKLTDIMTIFFVDDTMPVGQNIYRYNAQDEDDPLTYTIGGVDGGIKYLTRNYTRAPETEAHDHLMSLQGDDITSVQMENYFDRGILLNLTGASASVPQVMQVDWAQAFWVEFITPSVYTIPQETLPYTLPAAEFLEHINEQPWETSAQSFLKFLEAPFKLIKDVGEKVVHFVEHPHVEHLVKQVSDGARELAQTAQQFGPAFAQMGAMTG